MIDKNMPLVQVCQLEGVKDLPNLCAVKFGKALLAEAAAGFLNEALAAEAASKS